MLHVHNAMPRQHVNIYTTRSRVLKATPVSAVEAGKVMSCHSVFLLLLNTVKQYQPNHAVSTGKIKRCFRLGTANSKVKVLVRNGRIIFNQLSTLLRPH